MSIQSRTDAVIGRTHGNSILYYSVSIMSPNRNNWNWNDRGKKAEKYDLISLPQIFTAGRDHSTVNPTSPVNV